MSIGTVIIKKGTYNYSEEFNNYSDLQFRNAAMGFPKCFEDYAKKIFVVFIFNTETVEDVKKHTMISYWVTSPKFTLAEHETLMFDWEEFPATEETAKQFLKETCLEQTDSLFISKLL